MYKRQEINKKMTQFKVFHKVKYIYGICSLVSLTGLILLILKYYNYAVWFLIVPLIISIISALYVQRVKSQQKYSLINVCESIYNQSNGKLISSFSFRFQMISRKGMMNSNSKENYIVIEINPAHRSFFRKKTVDLKQDLNKKWDGEDINLEKPKTLIKAVSYTHLTLPTTPYV